MNRSGESRRAALLAVPIVLAVLAACGSSDQAATPSTVGSATTAPTAATVGDRTIGACPGTPATDAVTHLRPRTITAAPGQYDLEAVPGTFTVLRGPDLPLPDGTLRAGSPPDLYLGSPDVGSLRLADGPVVATTAVGVLTDTNGGAETAFVELRLPGGPPERWETSSDLAIGTDGGDAGFASTRLSPVREDDVDEFLDTYVAVSAAGSVPPPCTTVDQRDAGLVAVFFGTGGDGAFPVAVGRDAAGRVVGVAFVGSSVPWSLSGLPGQPPAEVAQATLKRRLDASR